MLKVGLTGGIGAGKSEVSRLLAGYGAVLVDADRIAREVVEPGTPGLAAVVEAFGEDVLTAEGALDRPKLGTIVFADPAKLQTLNAIVHPLVGARSAELEAAAGPDAIVVHDVPLLAENGLAPLYDLVVVVDAAPRDAAGAADRAARDGRGRGAGPDGRAGHARAAARGREPRDRQRRPAGGAGAAGAQGMGRAHRAGGHPCGGSGRSGPRGLTCSWNSRRAAGR